MSRTLPMFTMQPSLVLHSYALNCCSKTQQTKTHSYCSCSNVEACKLCCAGDTSNMDMSAATMLKNVVESLEGTGNPLAHVYVQARLLSSCACAARLCAPDTLSILRQFFFLQEGTKAYGKSDHCNSTSFIGCTLHCNAFHSAAFRD